jgi:hypothetical protein
MVEVTINKICHAVAVFRMSLFVKIPLVQSPFSHPILLMLNGYVYYISAVFHHN